MIRRIHNAALYALAPAVCLLLFWRVFGIWFLTDDFAWLGLHLHLHSLRDLGQALFHPYAQGTVRVLSERLYFLVFSSLFELNPAPFRVWALLTWFADLALAAMIGRRLTGSQAAGILAAALWTSSVSVVRGLAWASAYDQILCALCLLAAFYARLRWLDSGRRKWMIAEWAAYLAGFGALESIVVYPLLAALHGWCSGRRRIANFCALAAPAVGFTAFHLFYLPRDPNYPIVADHRLPSTLLHYLGWAIGPRQLGEFPGTFQGRGVIVVAAIAAALIAFAARCVLRREFAAVFFCGWFVLTLAPVLPLPNNIQDYYLTIPVLGLAWLAAWGIVTAWNAGWIPRAAAAVLLIFYLPGTIRQIDDSLAWFEDRTSRLRTVVLGLRDQVRAHPDSAFIIEGVDADVYQSGFEDDPFRLFGLSRIYLAHPRGDIAIAKRFIPPADLVSPRILRATSQGLRDAVPRQFLVDVSAPAQGSLGPGWYGPEPGYRWMGKTAALTLANPGVRSPELYVVGFTPSIALAAGPLTVRFLAGEREIGSAELTQPSQTFSLAFPLPPGLAAEDSIAITVEVGRTTRVPGDPRELGLPFKTFEIR